MNNAISPSTDLIPINSDSEGKRTVNARDLYEFLEVKTEFRNWIKNRIKQYGFMQDVNFIAGNFLPGSEQIDYHLTIDMAKELSMVKRNPERFPSDFVFQLTKDETENLRCQSGTFEYLKGVKYLPYAFTREGANMLSAVLHTDIAVERSVQIMRAFSALEEKAQNTPDPMRALNDPAAMRSLLLTYTEKVLALEETVEKQKPKAEGVDRIANSDGATNVTTTAKSLQMRPMDLFALMSNKKWIYRRPDGKGWIGHQDKIQRGFLIHKVTTVSTSDGREKTVEQVLVPPKGLTHLAKLVGHETILERVTAGGAA